MCPDKVTEHTKQFCHLALCKPYGIFLHLTSSWVLPSSAVQSTIDEPLFAMILFSVIPFLPCYIYLGCVSLHPHLEVGNAQSLPPVPLQERLFIKYRMNGKKCQQIFVSIKTFLYFCEKFNKIDISFHDSSCLNACRQTNASYPLLLIGGCFGLDNYFKFKYQIIV